MTPHYGDTTALHQMGVVSSFAPSQSKTLEPVRGVGFGDKIAEIVPGVTEPTQGSLERTLLYLCNLWQAVGYAGGVDGPVRSLAHHRWPFDIEQQLVFSTLADNDLGYANDGYGAKSGNFNGGVKSIEFPQVTNDVPRGDYPGGAPGSIGRGHTAIITIYEACWFSGWNTSYAKDAAVIMETGEVQASDTHDFASVYGEFLATGNDPTIGQLGSIRFAESVENNIAQSGRGIGGGGQTSLFAQDALNVAV